MRVIGGKKDRERHSDKHRKTKRHRVKQSERER